MCALRRRWPKQRKTRTITRPLIQRKPFTTRCHDEVPTCARHTRSDCILRSVVTHDETITFIFDLSNKRELFERRMSLGVAKHISFLTVSSSFLLVCRRRWLFCTTHDGKSTVQRSPSTCGNVTNETERNVELIQGDHLFTQSAFDGSPRRIQAQYRFKTDGERRKITLPRCDNHALVGGPGFQCSADCVRNTGQDDGPLEAKVVR